MLDLDQLESLARSEAARGGLSRRFFLGSMAALAAVPFLGRSAHARVAAPWTRFSADPFTLGVASGDPDSRGFVLWTKLAPDPTLPDGGITDAAEVAWEVAEDEAMTKVIRKGTATASAELGHSVHVELNDLLPDRWYWYRFRSGDAQTAVGRARTLPEPGATPDKVRFAFASCQSYTAGYYTAYDHMAREDLDLVFHLGDYIYEGAGKAVRAHSPVDAGKGPLMTLADYRRRHMQYRGDASLQAAHARCPWFVTWDDHEVSNNYASDLDGKKGLSPAEFLIRRAAAYRAYYEMMPLRPASMPKGPDLQLFRKASFGRLAEFMILDTRQHRSDQPNDDKPAPLNAAALDPRQTIMGAGQKAWLKSSLAASKGAWNVVAQQVMMGMLGRPAGAKDPHPHSPPGEERYGMDSWCGYAAERMEVVRFMQERRIANPVVLTGDVHANYVNELRVDDREHGAPVVAAEFVGTSISSAGDGADRPADLDTLLAHNPGLRYHNRERGFVRCTVTPKTWTADYLTVAKVTEKGAPLQHRRSFVVESGAPGIKPA